MDGAERLKVLAQWRSGGVRQPESRAQPTHPDGDLGVPVARQIRDCQRRWRPGSLTTRSVGRLGGSTLPGNPVAGRGARSDEHYPPRVHYLHFHGYPEAIDRNVGCHRRKGPRPASHRAVPYRRTDRTMLSCNALTEYPGGMRAKAQRSGVTAGREHCHNPVAMVTRRTLRPSAAVSAPVRPLGLTSTKRQRCSNEPRA